MSAIEAFQERLIAAQDLADAAQTHPPHDHYLPLLYGAGAVDGNADFQSALMSIRSVVWG